MSDLKSNIDTVVLIESFFQREIEVEFVNFRPELEVNVNTFENDESTAIQVVVSIDYEQWYEDNRQVRCTIAYIGEFKFDTPQDPNFLNKFGNINGAAIIYGYIREHLSSLLLKSGLNNFHLPTYNFIKKYDDDKEKSLTENESAE